MGLGLSVATRLRHPLSYGSVSFVGALDDYTTGLIGAYSVSRRLLASYTGPLIRVRRSSDNTEDDIGCDVAGDLDTAALLTFSGGGNAFIVTLYDQSVAALNLEQATTGKQPKIVNSGSVLEISSGVPGMQFDGSDDSLGSASSGLGDWRTLHIVAYNANAAFAGYEGLVGDDTQGGGSHTLIGNSGGTTFYAIDPTAVPSSAYYLNGSLNGSLDAPMQSVGVVTLESAAGYSTRSNPFLGADRQIGGRYWNGVIAEYIVYDDVDGTRRGAISTDQIAYF